MAGEVRIILSLFSPYHWMFGFLDSVYETSTSYNTHCTIQRKKELEVALLDRPNKIPNINPSMSNPQINQPNPILTPETLT